MRRHHFLLLALVVSQNAVALPYDANDKPAAPPTPLARTINPLLRWLRRIGFLNGGSPWRGGDARGSDAKHQGSPFNEGVRFPSGLGGPLGGWAWSENEISVVVRITPTSITRQTI
jgi:hypothetical protein